MTRPTTASLLAKKRARMSDHWLTRTTVGSAPCCPAVEPAAAGPLLARDEFSHDVTPISDNSAGSGESNARVEGGVQQIHDQVQHDEDRHTDRHHTDDDGVVVLLDRSDQREPDASQLKMVSVMIAPPSSAPKEIPTYVITGITELRMM